MMIIFIFVLATSLVKAMMLSWIERWKASDEGEADSWTDYTRGRTV